METRYAVLIVVVAVVLVFGIALFRKYKQVNKDLTESRMNADGTCTQVDYSGNALKNILNSFDEAKDDKFAYQTCAARGMTVDCQTTSKSKKDETFTRWAHTQSICDAVKAKSD